LINSIVNKIRPLAKRIIKSSYRPAVNRIYFGFTRLFYAGRNVYCFCCDSSYSKFLPYYTYNQTERENAQCPGCGSLERHRLITAFLLKETNLMAGRKKLLHFAPEDVLQRRLRQEKNLDYTSVDIASPLAMLIADIMNLPIDSTTIDAILCNHVLAHVEDDRQAMRELYRILKPGGWAVITTTIDFNRPTFEVPGPLTPAEKLSTYGQVDLCRIYGYDITQRLESVGFSVNLISYSSRFSDFDKKKFGFNNEVILFGKKDEVA
jgi:SAM-dependent methyltransferase